MDNSETPYQPVDCQRHSEYELAIMHKATLCLCWTEGSQKQCAESAIALDLITRNKQEFLKILTADHKTYDIRLDKILSFSTTGR